MDSITIEVNLLSKQLQSFALISFISNHIKQIFQPRLQSKSRDFHFSLKYIERKRNIVRKKILYFKNIKDLYVEG